MVEEKIKNIISGFIKIPVDEITEQTIIDRSVIVNSILLHRMYASLQKEGIVIDNYFDIKTFGALLERYTGKKEPYFMATNKPASLVNDDPYDINLQTLVGIDIEEIASMPNVNDFREDDFYTMNFSSSEIAYCILQPNPQASFAGLFAVKEALVKANTTYKNKTFNTIIIDHLPDGKPTHPRFQLSISHTSTVAVGIAIKTSQSPEGQNTLSASTVSNNTNNISLLYLLSITAIILSVIAILLSFLYK